MNLKIKKIKEFWKDFSSNKVAVVSLIVFILILFVAVFAPLVSPTDPYDLNTVSIMNSRLAPFSEDFSGNYFLLGTDGAGRDMVSGDPFEYTNAPAPPPPPIVEFPPPPPPTSTYSTLEIVAGTTRAPELVKV